MKAIRNRLSAIEELISPKEKPTAWIAHVNYNGSVKASHIKHGNFNFMNVDEFEAFRKEKGIAKGDYIQVIFVNAKDCKGDEPREL